MTGASKAHLLVVDDEPLNRELLRRVLQREYEVAEAEDAAAALAVLEERHEEIRVILCDQLMPGRSGTQLASEVKQRWPNVAFLLLTGYDEDDDVRAAHADGIVRSVVAKPWRGPALKALIEQVLGDA